MENNADSINLLLKKLEELLARQEYFVKEVDALQKEIVNLRDSQNQGSVKSEVSEVKAIKSSKPEIIEEVKSEAIKPIEVLKTMPIQQQAKPVVKAPKTKSSIEKFIGENLINKIGIIITVIGVGIGAKYSIEHDLISPLTRIILGYLVGLGLLGFGFKLKSTYKNYSAVLVSGAMAIMYFMTFAAYSFYGLFPQTMTFGLMFVFTIFTVLAALNYNQQVIAYIGLVGAYAVPFLLSNGSGNVLVLFGYMVIVNLGILFVAFKKYWKPLYYISFAFTWLIYISWFFASYTEEKHFTLALVFAFVFFIIFYVIFIAYKLNKKEKFVASDVVLVLLNSFIFYSIGYFILDEHEIGTQLLGVFTLCNAIVHFTVSVLFFKQKLGDRNLFYLAVGMVLVFITIAIPVQLDGNWVTILWAGEAALLFWIGRTKGIHIYEKIAYSLFFLSFFSLLQDWSWDYNYHVSDGERNNIPLFNVNFLSSLLVMLSFGFINWLNQKEKYTAFIPRRKFWKNILAFCLPAIFLYVCYYAFVMEINTYWDVLYKDSGIKINSEDSYNYRQYNYDLRKFKSVWVMNYTLLFLAVLSFINCKWIKNRTLGLVNLGLNTFALLSFLIATLYSLSELRESYLEETLSEFYNVGWFNIGIRYISFVFVILLVLACYFYSKQKFMKVNLKVPFGFMLHLSILWILSSEVINWMDISGAEQSYKLGLSILWGIYALGLIVLGIWKKKQYLRLGAMILFGLTLVKLFFYDIADLNTIAKTIVFVSLGVLLLIISFLYNKYKNVISDENED